MCRIILVDGAVGRRAYDSTIVSHNFRGVVLYDEAMNVAPVAELARHSTVEVPNMDVIGIFAQKGGVGKTHLGTNWAVEAECTGLKSVAVLDLDPQGTAASWSQRRLSYQNRDTPIMLRATVDQVEDVLDACRREGVELLFVDTNPSVEGPVTATAGVADLAVIPSGPSIADMESIGPTVAIVRNFRLPGCIVVNQGRPGSPINAEAASTLEGYELPVCPTLIMRRAAIMDAFVDGRVACELDPRGKAADEIATSWRWIAAQLKGVKSGDQQTK